MLHLKTFITASRTFRSHGFTLIEMLVVMGIMMVLTGGLIASYTSYNKNQKLRQVAITLKNDLRFLQNKAVSGKKPAGGCTELLGYTVSFTANSYTERARCSEGPVGEITSVSLPTSITFSPIPGDILFGVLTRGVDANVVLSLTDGTRIYRITVSESGDINDTGFQ